MFWNGVLVVVLTSHLDWVEKAKSMLLEDQKKINAIFAAIFLFAYPIVLGYFLIKNYKNLRSKEFQEKYDILYLDI